MGNDYKELYSKVFFIIIIIAILIISFLIIRPFIPSIITGMIIAYLFYPLYNKSKSKIKNDNIRAFLISILLILIVSIPVIVTLSILAREAIHTYSNIQKHEFGSNFVDFVCSNEDGFLCKTTKSFLSILPEPDLNYYLRSTLEKGTSIIIQTISKLLKKVPSIILNLIIILFVVFYVLRDGKQISNKILKALPLDNKQKTHVLKKFGQITYGVFVGNLAVAGIQGIVGGIGFMLLGISSPILWGIVMALFALVPYFGTAIIWVPAALNLIIIGNLTSENSMVVKGIILIVYGVLVVSSIDNILKPKIIGQRASVHPLLVLLGVLGGLDLFGLIGVIIGPILLAFLLVLVGIYQEELKLSS